jgi:hypothetical protein
MKCLFLIAALLMSVACFSQYKTAKAKDSIPKNVLPAPPPAPVEKSFTVTMILTEWQYLFYLVRTNGKLTAAQAEEYIDQLQSILVPVKDSVKTK